MKKILMITTGGTIASARTENGLVPTFTAEELLRLMPEISQIAEIDTVSLMSVDSSNMNPALIAEIAESVYHHYDSFDGFVITHGTDTMAYTAAALVYMLQNLGKPVVLTGSQVVVGALFSDTRRNLSDAFLFALDGVPGVFIAFDGSIINGARGTKFKSKSPDAFASINFPIIADTKQGKIDYSSLMYHGPYSKIYEIDKARPLVLNTRYSDAVALIKLYPGIRPEIFDCVKACCKGVVIESFGVGGVPNRNPDLNQKIQDMLSCGISVVMTTQCVENGTALGVYEVGKFDMDLIIDGGDMNTEAIMMKLMCALGNFSDPLEIKRFMESPVMGDITPKQA